MEKEEETWFREDEDDDDDSIEDEDDGLDIYVPNKRAPPSLRLTSRIKRQKTERDETSESSISSIFSSTFKGKPEDRKLSMYSFFDSLSFLFVFLSNVRYFLSPMNRNQHYLKNFRFTCGG